MNFRKQKSFKDIVCLIFVQPTTSKRQKLLSSYLLEIFFWAGSLRSLHDERKMLYNFRYYTNLVFCWLLSFVKFKSFTPKIGHIWTKGRCDYRMPSKWPFSRRHVIVILTSQMVVIQIFLTVAVSWNVGTFVIFFLFTSP